MYSLIIYQVTLISISIFFFPPSWSRWVSCMTTGLLAVQLYASGALLVVTHFYFRLVFIYLSSYGNTLYFYKNYVHSYANSMYA